MLVIIAYDIPDNKRRREVFHYLKDFGEPRLRSVFECWVDPTTFAQLQRGLAWIVESREDSVRCYLLCAHCERRIAAHQRRPRGYSGAVIL